MNNLIKRSLSGLAFLLVMCGAILWCKYAFAVLFCIIMTVMIYEFQRMTMGKRYPFSQLLSMVTAITVFILTFLFECGLIPYKMIMAAFIPFFIVMIDSLYVKDKTDFSIFANLYTALLYIAMPMTLTNFAVFSPDGAYDGMHLLAFFIIIWASDVGAYVFGVSLGQKYGKKLFPSISPKKSWIGFWGGLATAVGTGALLWKFGALQMSLPIALGLSVVMNVAGVYGDLIESQWKRHFEVKDSGIIIPGHGGMLDRFDSALTAIPMGLLYLMFVGA
ncbi:MAG: phosphatidate cytidylyltransferase [Candidatus Cryptobacteroides sp.]